MGLCGVWLGVGKEYFQVGPRHFTPRSTQNFSPKWREKRDENSGLVGKTKMTLTFCSHLAHYSHHQFSLQPLHSNGKSQLLFSLFFYFFFSLPSFSSFVELIWIAFVAHVFLPSQDASYNVCLFVCFFFPFFFFFDMYHTMFVTQQIYIIYNNKEK